MEYINVLNPYSSLLWDYRQRQNIQLISTQCPGTFAQLWKMRTYQTSTKRYSVFKEEDP